MYRVIFREFDKDSVEVSLESWKENSSENINSIKFALLCQQHKSLLSPEQTITCLEYAQQLMFSVIDEQGNCVHQLMNEAKINTKIPLGIQEEGLKKLGEPSHLDPGYSSVNLTYGSPNFFCAKCKTVDKDGLQVVPSLQSLKQTGLKELLELQVKLCEYSLHLQSQLSLVLNSTNKLHSK